MSDTPSYFTSNGHILVTGITGAETDYGGKSALATWWADNPGRERELVIWGNFKHDDVASVLEDFTEVQSVEELADAMGRGDRRLILSPTDPDWEAVSRRLESFVRALPADMSKLVVLDEAPELDEKAVLSFVRVHGNGANCKSLVLAQSPTDVSSSIYKQTSLCWVGLIKTSYLSWFRTHDLEEAFHYIEESHDAYHWTVVTGPGDGDWDHFDPVPEKYGGV